MRKYHHLTQTETYGMCIFNYRKFTYFNTVCVNVVVNENKIEHSGNFSLLLFVHTCLYGIRVRFQFSIKHKRLFGPESVQLQRFTYITNGTETDQRLN